METESGDARSEPVVLDEEFVEGLTSWGPKGASALALLRDAARLLTDGGVLERPDVAALACCRAALEILTELSGTKTEGLAAARTGLETAVADFLAARDMSADSAVSTSAPSGDDLRDLEAAFARLCAERAVPGGYRDRKVLLLVEQTARMAPGDAERAAVRVWSKLYADASAVVHGGSCTHAEAVRMFDESVAAIRQVFVALPHRAPQIRALALSEEPTVAQAADAAGWTDPRARLYFLRVATSPRWLELFDAHPGFLTPDPEAWPALGFLHRMRETHPDEVARWLDAHFDAVRARGAWATLRAIALARGSVGLRGRVLEAIGGPEDAEVAGEAGEWALDLPGAARDRDWVLLVERVLDRLPDTPAREWTAGRLLDALVELAADTHTRPEPAAQALGRTLRVVCAGLLGRALGDDAPHAWSALAFVPDLTAAPTDGPRPGALARVVLEVAALDAVAGVPLTDRTRFARSKITHEPSRDRVLAVHLTRTADAPTDGADAQAWWDEAARLLPRVMSDRARPDLGTFVAAAAERCPAHERHRVHAAMSAALGTAPDTEALERGRAAWDASGRPPSAWLPAWDWSAVLPDPVLAPWRKVLAVMEERVGRPAPDPRVPFDPTPFTLDALGPELRALTELAATRGAPECARAVAATPRDERERLIHRLVLTEPGPWAQEPAAVVDALPDDTARRAYLVALAQAFTDHTTLTPDTLSAALTAAAALPTPATGRDPLAELALVALDRDDIDTGWSDTILTRLTETTGTTLDAAEADPLDPTDPDADPDAVTDAPWGDDAYFHALNHPAARALHALLKWGLRLPHGDADPALPRRLTDVLHAHLREPRERPRARAALHSLIGAYLAALHERAPQWVDEHADVLLTLPDPRGPHPVRTHLQWGPPVPALLARVDGDELAAALRVPLEHVARHVAVVHLYDPGVLAPLDAFLTTLAAGPGGPRAVSDLLEETARALPDEASDQLVDVALDLWRTALDTDLPAESLAGAGAFAHARALDPATWADLAARTAATTLPDDPPVNAARAAEHPDSLAAFALLTALLQRVHPTHWHTERVRDHARALLAAETPHVSETDRALLRNALLDSGDLDA